MPKEWLRGVRRGYGRDAQVLIVPYSLRLKGTATETTVEQGAVSPPLARLWPHKHEAGL